jgi:EpsI family protein
MNPTRRTALVLGAGMGAASLLAALGKPRPADGNAPRLDLDKLFPNEFGPWRIDPAMTAFVRPAAAQAKRFGIYDQVLERSFIGAGGQSIMLSVAYGGEQSAGMQLHRPEVCYQAGGFEVRGTHAAVMPLDARQVPVTRLRAELPGRPEPITYWTLLGGVVVADAGSFRLRRLSFAARRELVDGMLVRVSSIDPDAARAYAVHQAFAADMVRAMAPADRAKVVGA